MSNPFDIAPQYVIGYECKEQDKQHHHCVIIKYNRFIRRYRSCTYISTFNIIEELDTSLFTIIRIQQKVTKPHPCIENEIVELIVNNEPQIVSTLIPIFAVKHAIYHHMSIEHD